jgi:hypothetical protein
MEVSRSSPSQQQAIAKLLKSTFGSGLSPALLSDQLLQWKFFSSRFGLPGSRSYVISRSEEIQAHACEWPISFLTPSGQVSSCHIIDWAALPEAKGTGVSIYQHLMKKNETVLAIGGSAHARRLLPKLGFERCGTLDSFAVATRSWQQYRSRPQRNGWRDIARLARNSVWSFRLRAVSESEWMATRSPDANNLPEKALRVTASKFCLGVRSASWLQYLLDCPVMNCRVFSLSKAGAPRGYFLFNEVAGQCRIIDLAVDSEAPEDWVAAYRVAVITAIRQKTTCEITAVSSLPWLSQGLKEIGFHLRRQTPVALYDPARKLVNVPPLHLRMTDSDGCFLYDERYPFST